MYLHKHNPRVDYTPPRPEEQQNYIDELRGPRIAVQQAQEQYLEKGLLPEPVDIPVEQTLNNGIFELDWGTTSNPQRWRQE